VDERAGDGGRAPVEEDGFGGEDELERERESSGALQQDYTVIDEAINPRLYSPVRVGNRDRVSRGCTSWRRGLWLRGLFRVCLSAIYSRLGRLELLFLCAVEKGVAVESPLLPKRCVGEGHPTIRRCEQISLQASSDSP
jgi:hypothetical protein